MKRELKARVDEQLLYEFQVELRRRRTNMRAVLEEFVRQWLKSPQADEPTVQSPKAVVELTDVQPGDSQRMMEPTEGYAMVPCPVELVSAWTAFRIAYEQRHDTGARVAGLSAEVETVEGRIGSALGLDAEDNAADEGSGTAGGNRGGQVGNPSDKPRKRAGEK